MTSPVLENFYPKPMTAPASPGSLEIIDPFSNLQKLALGQDFAAAIGVKRILTKIPIQRPSKGSWVMTHPNDAYWFPTMLIELKDENQLFLVAPELRDSLIGESTFVPRLLVPAIARPSDLIFLWPIPLPGADGKTSSWHESAMDAAKRGQKQWIRTRANMQMGGYEVSTAAKELPAPKWPDVTINDLLRIAFKDRYIEKYDHPTLKRLRGEI